MEYLYGKLKTVEREGKPMPDRDRLAAARGPLLDWYHRSRRILPWREDPQPYRVWISEIMLQQTRVEAVKPYFSRFMEQLPDVRALADAPEEELLKLWEGLGYYSRARNLQKAAKMMAEEYGGRLPASYEALLKLPGIGSYTAGAVSSIAFGIPKPAVDGNVLRVTARVLEIRDEIGKPQVKKRIEGLLGEVMDREMPGDYNQAWIELGALVCIPAGKPLCGSCPLNSVCLACQKGVAGELPVRAEKKKRRVEEKTVFLLEWEGRASVRKRSGKGLLASLYEFPNVPGYVREEEIPAALGLPSSEILEIEPLRDSKHIFSHVEWHMKGYRVKLRSKPPLQYPMLEKTEILNKYPLPNAFWAYTKVLL